MWKRVPANPIVFSAHAEVVPRAQLLGMLVRGILRARGGSSYLDVRAGAVITYSPRTRR